VDVVEDPEHPGPGRKLLRDAAKLEEGRHGVEESRIPLRSAAVRRSVCLALGLSVSLLAGCGKGNDAGASSSRDLVPLNPGGAPADTGGENRPASGAEDGAGASPAQRPLPVGAGAPLVVFLGDSLTAGLGLPVDQAFPAVVAAELAKRGRPIRAVNAGVSGDTTAGGLRRAQWVLSQRPDVVVLALGANDGLRGLPLVETEKNLRGVVATARAAGARVLLCGMLIPTSYGPEYQEGFSRLFPRVARAERIPLVPFLLDGVAGKKDLNLEDGIHPNAEGQRVLAANVLLHLEPLLAPAAR
jgi:acyl-CoA thioesterase-1